MQWDEEATQSHDHHAPIAIACQLTREITHHWPVFVIAHGTSWPYTVRCKMDHASPTAGESVRLYRRAA